MRCETLTGVLEQLVLAHAQGGGSGSRARRTSSVGVAWFVLGIVYFATVHHPVAGLILVVTAFAWLFTVTSRGFARPSR